MAGSGPGEVGDLPTHPDKGEGPFQGIFNRPGKGGNSEYAWTVHKFLPQSGAGLAALRLFLQAEQFLL